MEVVQAPLNNKYKSRMFSMVFGDKPELLERCRTLKDYAEYVARARIYAEEMGIGNYNEIII